MILLLANLLINLFNYDIDKAKRLAKWILYAIAGIILFFVVLFVFRSCNKPKVVLNEAEIQKINEAIDTNNRERMEKVFVEIETKQQRINANIANGHADAFTAIEKAKQDVKEMSNDELAEHLESLK